MTSSSRHFESAPTVHETGREAGVSNRDHQAVRLWLRLLACSTQIEQTIRGQLRARFGTTLPRFDYLAQLDRHPGGLRMSALSAQLMVTGGNITGLTDQLVAEALVERVDDPQDRRAMIVRMTPAGRTWFAQMAVEHEAWLVELFGGLGAKDMAQLYQLLGKLRQGMAQPAAGD
jgi:DNA-binding MarR family transcriptional regulator